MNLSQKQLGDLSAFKKLEDRFWRINNLYSILNKDGVVIKFHLKPVQEKLFKALWYRNIIPKARQLGITSVMTIIFLDAVLFKKNQKAAIIANTEDKATEIFDKIKFAWDHLDEDIKKLLKLSCTRQTASVMEFSNGSKIEVAVSVRSKTIQYLHISEYGSIVRDTPIKAKEIKTGSFPAVPAKGLITIESTVEESVGEFADMINTARERQREIENGGLPLMDKEFKFHFFAWWEDADYKTENVALEISTEFEEYFKKLEDNYDIKLSYEQKVWYVQNQREQKKDMKKQYPSHIDEVFETSGKKMFDIEQINQDIALLKKNQQMICKEGDLKIYEDFIDGERYAIGSDIAQGIGKDSTTAVVMKFGIPKNKVVATYRNNWIEPDKWAFELANIGNRYGECLIAPERNNHGWATLSVMRNFYPNIFVQSKEAKFSNITLDMLGWQTTGGKISGTKPQMIYELKSAYENGSLDITDPEILYEMRLFDKEMVNEEIHTEEMTQHFDLLIACAIAFQMRKYATCNFTESTKPQKKTWFGIPIEQLNQTNDNKILMP